MGKLTDPRDMKQPPAPIVGNTSTKQGPHANAKTTAPQPKTAKPDGNVAADMKKHGQRHGVRTLAEQAKKLYPSSK